jgi:hypothetical protein
MTEVEKRIRRRARHRGEYCKLPQFASRLRHQPDHIIWVPASGLTDSRLH